MTDDVQAVERQILDDVAAYGWQCITAGDGIEEPTFTHSIGWPKTLGCAEVIIFGLPREYAHGLLTALFERIQAGLVLDDLSQSGEMRLTDLLEGYACVLKPVHPAQCQEYLSYANWFYQHSTGAAENVTAYQLFWPGREDSLFPWEDGAHPAVVKAQPLLQAAN